MKLTGMVLRNDDSLPEDFDTTKVVLPESVRCTVDFDPTKPVGNARVWRDDDGNIMAEVAVEDDGAKYIFGVPDAEWEGTIESDVQFLSCAVIAPLKKTHTWVEGVPAPSLLDVSVIAKHSQESVPPMRIEP